MRSVLMTVFAVLIVGGFVAVVYGIVVRAEPVTQPIAFNHAIHLDDAGLECLACHTRAATDVSAGIPGKAVCLDCHDIDEEGGSHTEKDKLFAFEDTDGDIPWGRVAVTKPDVFFSHRRHVTSGKLDCLECHPDQAELDAPPPTAQLVMAMDDCIECHQQRGVSEDCLACHR